MGSTWARLADRAKGVAIVRASCAVVVSATLALLSFQTWANPARPYVAEDSGVLVAVTSSTTGADDRARSLAAGFVARGIESFVAHEMSWPPRDADRRVIRGRWRLDEARRLRGAIRNVEAAAAADAALALFAEAVTERAHLEFLIEALIERATNALILQDAATAETLFLEALALDPDYRPDPDRYPKPVLRLFGNVRRAARQLRFATLVVDAPGLPNAKVEVDFGGPRAPPYTVKLPQGRHFVSVSAPGRHPVVAPIPLRAERQHRVEMFAPTAGDGRQREEALAGLRIDRAATVNDLARVAGLRFVLAAELAPTKIDLQLYDGRTGQAVSGAQATISGQPSPKEIEAAIDNMMQVVLLAEPDLLRSQDQPGWYGTWWGATLIGVSVAIAAAGTAWAVTRSGTIEYRFEP